jgi:ribosomal protein L40E
MNDDENDICRSCGTEVPAGATLCWGCFGDELELTRPDDQ